MIKQRKEKKATLVSSVDKNIRSIDKNISTEISSRRSSSSRRRRRRRRRRRKSRNKQSNILRESKQELILMS